MPRLITIPLVALVLLIASCGERTINVNNDGSGFRFADITKGSGVQAQEGSTVTVHYTVALPDGTVIIDTRAKKRAHTFRIGGGTVITGMDRLVRGMRPGGVREATIPPTLHYGSGGYGGVIPPETMLEFRVELIRVRTG